MLLDPASDAHVRAGQIVIAAATAAFVAARWFGSYSRPIRLMVAGVYIGVVLGFVIYALR